MSGKLIYWGCSLKSSQRNAAFTSTFLSLLFLFFFFGYVIYCYLLPGHSPVGGPAWTGMLNNIPLEIPSNLNRSVILWVYLAPNSIFPWSPFVPIHQVQVMLSVGLYYSKTFSVVFSPSRGGCFLFWVGFCSFLPLLLILFSQSDQLPHVRIKEESVSLNTVCWNVFFSLVSFFLFPT